MNVTYIWKPKENTTEQQHHQVSSSLPSFLSFLLNNFSLAVHVIKFLHFQKFEILFHNFWDVYVAADAIRLGINCNIFKD